MLAVTPYYVIAVCTPVCIVLVPVNGPDALHPTPTLKCVQFVDSIYNTRYEYTPLKIILMFCKAGTRIVDQFLVLTHAVPSRVGPFSAGTKKPVRDDVKWEPGAESTHTAIILQNIFTIISGWPWDENHHRIELSGLPSHPACEDLVASG